MQWQDCINGLYELFGGIAICFSIRKLFIDKCIKGVHWLPIAFFASWGYWNLYYYQHLSQIVSWIGGIGVVTANTIWLGQIIYYSRLNKKKNSQLLEDKQLNV
jgi:hypothetical protein